MNRLIFKDRRGDEYVFIRYSTNEIKATKKSQLSEGYHQIDFSAEAIEKLHELLHQEER
ncbi:MAG TPA: hypothetical protein VKL21_10735 [Candidatus Methanoperedens sp.]|nr:hypothetical protein [Candidatus Methanoperedens sp.]